MKSVLQKSKSEFGALRGNLLLMLAFHEMLKSSSFKQKLVKGPFVELLATVIEKSDQCQSTQLKQFRKATFYVVDQLAKNAKLLNTHYNDIVEKLLPAIANQIDSQIPEVRFDALKAFSDYVTQFMCEEKIYQPLEDTASTQLLNELLLRKFLASYGTILTAQEPLPLLGLKLLSVIVERNAAFVLILKKLGLIQILFEYFQVGHAKFNAATLKIIRAIVASREIELEELLRMNIIEKINAIMNEFVSSNPEWCSDHLLVIMHEILHLAAELKKKKANSTVPQQVFDDLLVNFSAFCKLLSESDVVSTPLVFLTLVLMCAVDRGRCELHDAGLHPLLDDPGNPDEPATRDLGLSADHDSARLQAGEADRREEPAEESLLGAFSRPK